MGDETSNKFLDLLSRFLGENVVANLKVNKDNHNTSIIVPRKTKNISWNMGLSVSSDIGLVVISSTLLNIIRDRIRDAREMASYINGTSFMTTWLFDEDECAVIAHSYYLAPGDNFSGLPTIIDDHAQQIDDWAGAWFKLNSTNQHPKRIYIATLKSLKRWEDDSK